MFKFVVFKNRSFVLILICFFLCISAAADAAEVYYLNPSVGQSVAETSGIPSYSLGTRIHDLFDFSLNRSDNDRSGKISGSLSQEVNWQRVSGNSSKSFLENGVDYLSELRLNMQEKLWKDYNFEGQWYLRKTDNRRIETKRELRMKQINVKAYNPRNMFEFGDFYGDFSQFVLGTSLEGFQGEVSPDDMQSYKIIVARSHKPDVTANRFQRNTLGTKADYQFFKESAVFSNFRVGLQAVSSQDDSATIESNSSTKDLRNTVASIDGELSLKKYFSLAYELARSEYIEDEDTGNDTATGVALRVQPALDLGKIRLRYLYYYAQPKFYTDTGSVSSDKIQHQLSTDITLHKKAVLSLVENYYWDHLTNSSRSKRTTYDEKYAALTVRPFEYRPDFQFRPYMNYQIKWSDDSGNTAGGITRTIGFSVNDVLNTVTSVGVSYEYRGFTDTASRTTSDYFNRIGFNIARDWNVFGRRLYCSLDPSVDIRRNKADEDKDVTINAGFNTQYDFSSRLFMRAGNMFTDANGAKVATDFNNNRAFWEFDYLLGKERGAHCIMRGERNNYTSEDGNQSYREQRVIVKFLTQF